MADQGRAIYSQVQKKTHWVLYFRISNMIIRGPKKVSKVSQKSVTKNVHKSVGHCLALSLRDWELELELELDLELELELDERVTQWLRVDETIHGATCISDALITNTTNITTIHLVKWSSFIFRC